MKIHWLSIAGVVLLMGTSFGGELQWKKPMSSRSEVPTVTHIPSVMTMGVTMEGTIDEALEMPTIVQVQQITPIRPPQLAPVVAPTVPRSHVPQSSLPLLSATQSEPEFVDCSDLVSLKSIKEISHDIRLSTKGEVPKECRVDGNPYDGRHFSQSCFMWKASALSTKAAYFEDVQLERHGHTLVCPALQPVVSGAKFFATIPILPYKMGVTPPNECVYTLGHIRSGNCAPYMVQPFPLSLRGALFQAGAVTGVVFAAP